MTAKRYDPKTMPYREAMLEDTLGDYVKYSDYEKLESQNKELTDELMGIDHAEYCMCITCQPEFNKAKNKAK